jgi:hypothetical protein
MMQKEKSWEDKTGRFEWIPEDGANGWGDPIEYLTWKALPEKLFNTFYAISRGWPDRVWPRVTDGVIDEEVEVSVEVQTHIASSSAVCSACRCYSLQSDVPLLISCLWNSTVGTFPRICTYYSGSHGGTELFVLSHQYVAYRLE